MRVFPKLFGTLFLFSVSAFSQNYPYIVKNFAGTWRLGDGARAEDALLYYPTAAIPDTAGNLYILDASNARIRKVAPDGRISTFALIPTYAYDMKFGPDGSLYVGGIGGVLKVTQAGVVSVFAGNGTFGFSGDGGPATSASVGTVFGVAVDSAGVVYFSDVSAESNRIRRVALDGRVSTVAGGAAWGFRGDNGPATDALFDSPSGVAVDSAGAIYVADYFNARVRKFTVGGTIATFAGNGSFTFPIAGPATASGLGTPNGLFVDSRGNVLIADYLACAVMRVTPAGALTVVAGNFSGYIPIEDGPALSSSLRFPSNASADAAGNLFIVDETHRVRRVNATDGRAVTVAGKLHFSGDNGPATAAVMNEPDDIAFDAQGNAYILDAANYLIRRVTPAGVITTFAGKQNPSIPQNGSALSNAGFPYMRQILFDSRGAMYIACNRQIFKITDGIVNIFAGTGNNGTTGDGARATSATFSAIAGIALDDAGNLYVADSHRIRVINAETGFITAYAGSGTRGYAGDGSLATSAQFNMTARAYMVFDRSGNLYISDGNNFRVRMVTRQGAISTVVGNGTFGRSDNAPATASFASPGALAFDRDGTLFVASQSFQEIYRLSGGVLRRILGGNTFAEDGMAALDARFNTFGMKIDANGDIYCVDLPNSTVWKLMLNSPSRLAITDGNAQTAETGQALPKLLKVQLSGRAGLGVAGVTVNFEVKSGSARLSSASSLTDATGFAGITVTLGTTAGPVTIAATAAGTSLAVEFTATATTPGGPTAGCAATTPAVTSVRSAGDFGGSTTFASGSWLEIKGSQLSGTTRPWAGADFNGPNAPLSLDGVSVTVNGRRAFVGYISDTQINVQAPADTANGPLNLIVTRGDCPSAAFTVQKAAVAGGLLATSVFNIGGTQYIAALYQDGFTFVGAPGLIAGVPFRAAAPGDTITLYGIGFGDVTPSIPPGVVVSTANTLPGLTISFGSTQATVTYAGLAPNAIGLYQFNLTVPPVDTGDHRIVARVNGVEMPQIGYLTVQK
jgi:uncharacterized protein (TIGR03437 family)